MSLTLRLRAIDDTGSPVAGAVVRHADDRETTTDADGVAIIDDLETGFAMVTVSHSMPAEAQLVFSFGEGSSGVLERTVTLRRGAPLCGTVMRPDGTPLTAEAMVEVWCADGRTLFVESDAEGNWKVPAMQAGAYEVRASADGFARGPAVSGSHDGSTEQSGVDVRVAIGARLSGRVRDATGNASTGVRIYTEMQPGDDRSTTTDADGRFEIAGIGAGRHHVSVAHGRWTSSIVMPGDGGNHEIGLELPDSDAAPTSAEACSAHVASEPVSKRTATLTGRVLRDGVPVPEFAVVRKGVAAYRWISGPAMIYAPDGRFTLTALRETSFSVHILALGCAWTSIATIDVEPGSTHDLGEIALQPGLRISGIVCSEAGQPIVGAQVVIGTRMHGDPLHNAVDGNFETTSGPDGMFLLEGVHLDGARPRISASHPLHGASLEQSLVGVNETIRLVLVPTGAIDGEIEPHRAMHGGLIVRADAPDAGGGVVRVRPSGRFSIENLVPGDYSIELVQRPSWPRRVARATVVAGQRIQVRLPPP